MKLAASPVFKFVLPALLIFLLLRLIFWFATFPNPDEAYYWLWGQHPDFSYYDHPPLQAWVQGLFTAILGRSQFVLRLPNAISTVVYFYVYYQIANYLYGEGAKHYFWLILGLILASPLYFLFLALAWHDHLLITFSLISSYLFIRFLDSYLVNSKGVSWQLYGAAIAIALALLCKYNAIFVGLGLIATVIADQRLRPLLHDRRMYFAGAIAASALLPILIWNITNDFQSIRYYLDRSVDSGGLQIKIGELLKFLLYSVLMLSPVNVLAIVQVIPIHFLQATNQDPPTFGTPLNKGGRGDQCNRSVANISQIGIIQHHSAQTSHASTYRAVALWIFATSTFSLMAISLVSTALYYWNITAYLLLFPLLPGVFLKEARGKRQEARSEQKAKGIGKTPQSPISNLQSPILNPLFLTGQFYGLLFATLLVVHYSVLPLSAFANPSDDPDSGMLFGWNDVAAVVQTQLAELGNNPFLVTTDYRSASALAYQLDRADVIAISDRIDQFDFWYTPSQLQGRNAIILADDWHPVSPELRSQFDYISSPVTVPVKRFGLWIKNYYVLRGDRFRAVHGSESE